MIDWLGRPQGWLRWLLSLFGIIVITWSMTALFIRQQIPLWVFVTVLVANLAWLLLTVIPTAGIPTAVIPGSRIPVSGLLACVMVAASGVTAAAVDGIAIVPAAVGVLWVVRDIRQPFARGVQLGIAGMLVVLVGDLLEPLAPLGVAGIEAALIVALLGGLSRRQYVLAEVRSRELVEEQARTDVLGARAQLAADIHDVLAHSLGGLVIQLDAVDALLESGDTTSAAARVRDARTLAAEGLGEARRAVAALSDPPAFGDSLVAGSSVVADVVALVDAHRSLGGRARFSQSGEHSPVSAPVAVALRRAAQEGLTNARKHAPGKPVAVALSWKAGSVQLQISNPLGVDPAASADGHGLVGMRERFAGLPGGVVSAAATATSFVVTAGAQTS
jgi:signal transduction histidine kinase